MYTYCFSKDKNGSTEPKDSVLTGGKKHLENWSKSINLGKK